jgi:hypothetical protein
MVQIGNLYWYTFQFRLNLGCHDKLCTSYNQITCLFKVRIMVLGFRMQNRRTCML